MLSLDVYWMPFNLTNSACILNFIFRQSCVPGFTVAAAVDECLSALQARESEKQSQRSPDSGEDGGKIVDLDLLVPEDGAAPVEHPQKQVSHLTIL